jgi:hypothetical protein
VQNELKRTQIEPQLSAEMRALRVKFEFSSTAQVLAEALNGKGGCGRHRPVAEGNPEDCERIRESWEQSQEVLENKGHHFLQVANFACFVRKLTAISPQREQMTPHFCENEVRTGDSQRDDMTVTKSRLDKRATSVGADLICGRVAASYGRIVD